jgi:hypothetical protein
MGRGYTRVWLPLRQWSSCHGTVRDHDSNMNKGGRALFLQQESLEILRVYYNTYLKSQHTAYYMGFHLSPLVGWESSLRRMITL